MTDGVYDINTGKKSPASEEDEINAIVKEILSAPDTPEDIA